MNQRSRVSRSLFVPAGLVALLTGGLAASAARLPDVAPGDVLAGGALATLAAGEGAQLDGLAVVNPGDRPAMCMRSVLDGDGTPLGSPAPLEVPAQSMTYRSDLLAGVPDGARVTVRCDVPFYTFAVARDEKGATTVLRPLAVRTAGTSCGLGTVCYDFPGVDLVASVKTPTRAILLDPPVGRYSRVTVHLEVEIHGWTAPVTGAHGILYMIRDKNKDMFANIFLQGPASNGNALVLRHGFGQTHPEKAKLRLHFFPKDGQVYAFDYVYDPGAGKLSLSVKGPNGQEVVHLFSKPNVDAVTMASNQLIHIGLSNPGIVVNEPTSTGWVYKNLHVELTPAN